MEKKKLRLGLLCGGRSAEHEVSLQSARNVLDALDRDRYTCVVIVIDKQGRWFRVREEDFLLDPGDPRRIRLNPAAGEAAPFALPGVDVVFPLLHGPFGEDGTVQGFLKLADLPFVGAGVAGSAVGMDKELMKRLLRDAGLPLGKFRVLRAGQKAPPFDALTAELAGDGPGGGRVFFVKPANMGSSVGISKVHRPEEYAAALDLAFRFDTKVILEEFIPGRELECGVLGDRDEPRASVPGEVRPSHEFYSYEAKYLDENGAALDIPARLPPELTARVQDLAARTFTALECEGLGRVDFFLTEGGRLLVNEINTMPGFTRISMYPKLWEASGVPYAQLIDRLIALALRRFDREKGLNTSAGI